MDLPEKFSYHLQTARGVSPRTLRNYRSDLNHFFSWVSLRFTAQGKLLNDWESFLPHLTPQLLAEYKGYHLENKIPYATLNRRLSTLRNFTGFLHASGHLSENPSLLINNVQQETSSWQPSEKLIRDFKRHLKHEGVSQITLKNYLSDVRQFLGWYSRAGGTTPPK